MILRFWEALWAQLDPIKVISARNPWKLKGEPGMILMMRMMAIKMKRMTSYVNISFQLLYRGNIAYLWVLASPDLIIGCARLCHWRLADTPSHAPVLGDQCNTVWCTMWHSALCWRILHCTLLTYCTALGCVVEEKLIVAVIWLRVQASWLQSVLFPSSSLAFLRRDYFSSCSPSPSSSWQQPLM